MRDRPPVDLKQLHRTTVRMRGGRLRRASIFPFFDREGVVHEVMLIWPGSTEILVIDHSPQLLRVSWRGHVDFLARSSDLLDARGPVLERLTKLWHWDPWWVLRKKPWRVHSAVAALQRTNCVDIFDLPIRGCYTDLTVAKIFFEAKGGGEPTLPESSVHEPDPVPEQEEPAPAEVVLAEAPHAPAEGAPDTPRSAPDRADSNVADPAAPTRRRAGGSRKSGWRLAPVWENDWPPKIRDDR